MDITPKPLSPERWAEIELDNALEEACIAALERVGGVLDFDEREDLAKEIVAEFASRA